MSISVSYVSQLTVVETLGGLYVHGEHAYAPGTGDATVTTNGLNTTATLNASSTPPATKYSAGRLTLSGGAGTIDLTSLPDRNGVAAKVDLTGLKVSAYKLRSLSTNASNMIVGEGASNGYEVHGNGWTIRLTPGQEVVWKGVGAAGQPAVGSGAKTIDVTGTGSQVLEFEFVGG